MSQRGGRASEVLAPMLRPFYPEVTEREVLEHIGLGGREVLPEVYHV